MLGVYIKVRVVARHRYKCREFHYLAIDHIIIMTTRVRQRQPAGGIETPYKGVVVDVIESHRDVVHIHTTYVWKSSLSIF